MLNFSPTLLGIGLALTNVSTTSPTSAATPMPSFETVSHLKHFDVIELRRYTVADKERAHFARYFDSYFPEAFEQLGALVFGQFLERERPNGFTWLRGYTDMSARPIINSAFYYGPLWKEHRSKVNAILPDSDNVLLLRPLHPETGISVMPAVDPVSEPGGATGIVVAQLIPLGKDGRPDMTQRAEAQFERYKIQGVQRSGVLISLDAPNNFPQLPIRTDGPWLVWLGVAKNEQTLQALEPVMKSVASALETTNHLNGSVETVIMDPTPRSRLRWADPAEQDSPAVAPIANQ
ncbi:MAG: hypothetical protein ABIO59_04630 [Luteimonas sp.]